MHLYLLRHGETDWNKSKKIQGLTDIELNDKGKSQAEQMRDRLRNVNFTSCFSSPLKRARETAAIIVDGKCDIDENILLLERSFGRYEGMCLDDMNVDIASLWDYNSVIEDVETMKNLLNRADLFLKQLSITCKDDDHVAVVAHGGIIKALYYALNGYDENTDFLSFHLDNCEIYTHEYKVNNSNLRK